MKLYKVLSVVLLLSNIVGLKAQEEYKGKDRAGQSGFYQLLVNGWAQNSGFGNSNSASVFGIEALHMNAAGLGRIKGMDVNFSRTIWFQGTGISVNAFGFGTRVGSAGALGFALNSFGIGQIPITTEDQPGGNIGTYRPSINNISIAYAYNFTSEISAGFNLKIVSESTPEVRTNGIVFDAGLQYGTRLYQSGEKSKVKYFSESPAAKREGDLRFGVSLKNLGPDVRYQGDGLAVKSKINGDFEVTSSQRSDKTPFPSLFNVGMGFDFRLDKNPELYWHRLTANGNFMNSNFASNQLSVGLEYAYKEILMFRTAFDYEKGIFNYDTRRTAYTGLCVGVSYQMPFKKDNPDGNTFAFDYSYRFSNPFGGTHSFGVRVSLEGKDE